MMEKDLTQTQMTEFWGVCAEWKSCHWSHYSMLKFLESNEPKKKTAELTRHRISPLRQAVCHFQGQNSFATILRYSMSPFFQLRARNGRVHGTTVILGKSSTHFFFSPGNYVREVVKDEPVEIDVGYQQAMTCQCCLWLWSSSILAHGRKTWNKHMSFPMGKKTTLNNSFFGSTKIKKWADLWPFGLFCCLHLPGLASVCVAGDGDGGQGERRANPEASTHAQAAERWFERP